MITPGADNKLLDQAIRALKVETGLRINVVEHEYLPNERRADAFLQIEGPEPLQLAAEIKAWAQHVNTGALINQVRQLGNAGILITDYINPKLAERLKQNDVQFMDACGNAFIKATQLFIFIKGNKRREAHDLPEDRTARAFKPTGLKVTYTLLRNPALTNAPYRQIAEQANVALGTVGWVMMDLKDAGFLAKRGNRRILRNYEKLLQRWIETYPETLKPKMLVGRFLAERPDWWKEFPVAEYKAWCGAEIAAAKYTNYLKPEIATVYVKDTAHLAELLKAARLRKLDEWTTAPGMHVYVYAAFWKGEHGETDLVDPVLIYADLMATGDPRNREVALEIYGKYIAERIGET